MSLNATLYISHDHLNGSKKHRTTKTCFVVVWAHALKSLNSNAMLQLKCKLGFDRCFDLLFPWCLDDKDSISTKTGRELIQINPLRNGVNLSEVVGVGRAASEWRCDAKIISVQLDGDVLRRVLLHVQNLEMKKNCWKSKILTSNDHTAGNCRA